MSIAIDKGARRELRLAVSKLRAKALDAQPAESPNGWIEGYASAYNNVDLSSEIMLPGCFARSIQQVVPAGKVPLMARHFAHGGDSLECIGRITDAKEDDYGLWIHAELSSSSIAQDIRRLVLEGMVDSLSVAFRALRFSFDDPAAVGKSGAPVIRHQECALLEVTVTQRPCNPAALITAAKSQTGIVCPKCGLAYELTPTPENADGSQSTGKSASGTASGSKTAGAPAAPAAPPASHAIRRDLDLRHKRYSSITRS